MSSPNSTVSSTHSGVAKGSSPPAGVDYPPPSAPATVVRIGLDGGKGNDEELIGDLDHDDVDPDLDIGCFRRRSVLAESIFSQSSGKSMVTSFTGASPPPPGGLAQLQVEMIPDSPLAHTFAVRKTPTRPTNYDFDDAPGVELTKTEGGKEDEVKPPR